MAVESGLEELERTLLEAARAAEDNSRGEVLNQSRTGQWRGEAAGGPSLRSGAAVSG